MLRARKAILALQGPMLDNASNYIVVSFAPRCLYNVLCMKIKREQQQQQQQQQENQPDQQGPLELESIISPRV